MDHQNSSGLAWAVKKQRISVALYFLGLPEVDVNARNEARHTLLHTTAQQGDGHFMMRILLRESGIDINATDWQGRTPLSYSASNGDPFPLNML